MKVIENIELLKKLQPLLEGIDIDREICSEWDNIFSSRNVWKIDKRDDDWKKRYKTPNLEETIEFIWKWMSHVSLIYPNAWIWTIHQHVWDEVFEWETLIEAFSKFLEYLIDNNLLWNQ